VADDNELGSIDIPVRADLSKLASDFEAGRAQAAKFDRQVSSSFSNVGASIAKAADQQKKFVQSTSVTTGRMKLTATSDAMNASPQQLQQWQAGIRSYTQSLADQRAKLVPLFAAQRQYISSLAEIKDAAASGLISEKERSEAVSRTKDSFAAQVRVLNQVDDGNKKVTGSLLGHKQAVRGLVADLVILNPAMGDTARQAATLYLANQELLHNWGSLAQGARTFAGSFSVVGVTIGAVVVAILGLVAAHESYVASQREVELGLMGIGRASGTTRQQINDIAKAQSNWTTLSTNGARQIATEYARVGQIATDVIPDAVSVTEDLAKVLGVDTVKAAKDFAAVLANNGKGLDELNAKLGAWSDAQKSAIMDLYAANRAGDAQRIVINGVKTATEGAAKQTSFWGSIWNAVVTTGGNLFTSIGEGLSNFTGAGQTAQQELQGLNTDMAYWQKKVDEGYGPAAQRKVDQFKARIAEVTAELQKQADAATQVKQNVDSLALGVAVGSAVPEVGTRKALEQRLAILQSRKGQGGLSPENAAALDLATARTQSQLDNFKNSAQQAQQASELAIKAANARSPSELAAIARQQTLNQLVSQGYTEQEARGPAEAAATAARTQAIVGLTDAQKSRVLAIKDAIGQSDIEIQSIGQSAGAVALLKANWQSEMDLRRQAAATHTEVNKKELAELQELNAEMARKVQLAAQSKLHDDIQFDRASVFMGDDEAGIQSRLRSVYGDTDSAAKQADASYMRTTNAIKQAKDAATSFSDTLAQGFAQGKKGSDVLRSALTNLASTAISAFNKLAVNSLFSLFGGGKASAGGLFGGSFIPGLLHSGYTPGGSANSSARSVPISVFAGAPKFHEGKLPWLLPNEMPAIIDRREEVGYPDKLAKKYGNSTRERQGDKIEVTMNNDFRGASDSAVAQIAQRLAVVQDQVDKMPDTVAAARNTHPTRYTQ
jgi:hypothetical protein